MSFHNVKLECKAFKQGKRAIPNQKQEENK